MGVPVKQRVGDWWRIVANPTPRRGRGPAPRAPGARRAPPADCARPVASRADAATCAVSNRPAGGQTPLRPGLLGSSPTGEGSFDALPLRRLRLRGRLRVRTRARIRSRRQARDAECSPERHLHPRAALSEPRLRALWRRRRGVAARPRVRLAPAPRGVRPHPPPPRRRERLIHRGGRAGGAGAAQVPADRPGPAHRGEPRRHTGRGARAPRPRDRRRRRTPHDGRGRLRPLGQARRGISRAPGPDHARRPARVLSSRGGRWEGLPPHGSSAPQGGRALRQECRVLEEVSSSRQASPSSTCTS